MRLLERYLAHTGHVTGSLVVTRSCWTWNEGWAAETGWGWQRARVVAIKHHRKQIVTIQHVTRRQAA